MRTIFETGFRKDWLGQARMSETERDRIMGQINNHLLIAETLDSFTDDHGDEGVYAVLGDEAYDKFEDARGVVMEHGMTIAAIYDRLEGDPDGWWALTEKEKEDIERWSHALEEMETIVLVAQGKGRPKDGAPPTSGDMPIPVGVVALGGLAAAVGVFVLILG